MTAGIVTRLGQRGRRLAKLGHRIVSAFVEPLQIPRAILSVPWFVKTLRDYRRLSSEKIPWGDLQPALTDRVQAAGSFGGHYFLQDVWAATKVFESGCREHVDVGSRVDGFVAHCACFTQVLYVDVRPLEISMKRITVRSGDVRALPFQACTIPSLSCLHVAEHVGLGRYGDPLDPQGTHRAMRELERVLAPGGNLYFAVPIGRERVCFNAHRVLSPSTVLRAFEELTLREFAAVDDEGTFVPHARPEAFEHAEYSLGLFHFVR